MRHAFQGLTVVAVLVVVVGVAACGDEADNGISEQELQQAVREAEQEGRKEAELESKLDELNDKIDDLEAGDEGAAAATPAAEPSSTPVSSSTYVSEAGGWSAEVPVGGGWSDGVETQVNAGLMRTTFDGPGDSMLTIDATPAEAPAFGGAPVDSRSTINHPVFGAVEKVIFQGNSNFEMCDRGLCVDFLMDHGAGGFAVLAGGPGNFTQTEATAHQVMLSLRPL